MFMEKIGGCQSNFIGNEKNTAWGCSFQRVFFISYGGNWEVKSAVEIEFAALKIRKFFVNSADLLLSH